MRLSRLSRSSSLARLCPHPDCRSTWHAEVLLLKLDAPANWPGCALILRTCQPSTGHVQEHCCSSWTFGLQVKQGPPAESLGIKQMPLP